MSLQELSHLDRILFLLEFTAELVTHSTEDERLKKLIKVERLKRKLLKEDPDISHVGNSIIFNPPGNVVKFKKNDPKISKPKMRHSPKKSPHYFKSRPNPITSKFNKLPSPSASKFTNTSAKPIEDLMKLINPLINDKSVQIIECPGPEKNLLVKVRNRVNTTKIKLSSEEVKKIIIYFSDYARIPIVGGVLKTSVDNLMISAVVSEYTGSRFIIKKQNPYDLISMS